MDSLTQSLRDIFADAAEIAEPAAQAAFLDDACRGDRALRERVERLLAADAGAGTFFRHSGDTTRMESSEKPGDRIGRYRLVERIGRGGGGVVYLAEQEEPVRRRVALKILKLGMDTQSVVERFEAERQALAMMDHPNIARVLDAGATDTGRPFFVMELVEGQRLTDYCESRHLSLRQRLELFIPVCHAVQHAHQKGIIHRDLKPSNILVTEHEGMPVPKVIDFGIAKATRQGLDDQAGLTSMNHLLGTPTYMSPEQMEFGERDIDTRSDIYSLGVVLYELLTGKPPFDLIGAGIEQMRHLVREVDPLRPSTRIMSGRNRASLPSPSRASRDQLAAVRADLDWIVMKCLEKDRVRRYETANGLATDVRRHLENEPVAARPPTGFYRLQKVVRRHRLAFGAVGAVALVLIAATIVSLELAWRAGRAEREQKRLQRLAEANASESHERLVRRYVAEGNRLVEDNRPVLGLPWLVEALALEAGDSQREQDERLRIAQARVGTPELLLHISQGKSVSCVALSPDGSRLASGSDDGIVRISEVASGGTVCTNLMLPGAVGCLCFSPDGKRLVAADMGGRARVWNAASGEALTPLLQPPDSDTDTGRRVPPSASFSPDGKLLLLASGSKSAQLRDGANGSLLRQFSHNDPVLHAAFSPDGQLVVTSSRDGTARVWDVATGQAAAEPLQHTGEVVWAQFSPDGKKLLTMREQHFVQLWDWREGRRLAPEIPRHSVLSRAGLSPDGKRILTTAWSGFAHVYDAETSVSLYQFEHQGGVMDADFSPDGSLIATASHDGNVWVRDAHDASIEPMVLPEGNQIEDINFSNDGRLLAVGTRGGHARVWELSPPQHSVQRLPGDEVQWVEFDKTGGRALALSAGQKSGASVFDVKTGKLVSFAELKGQNVKCVRFSPDGRRILAFGSETTALVLDVDSGRAILQPLAHKDRVKDAFWSPDGKWIVTASGRSGARLWDASTGKVVLSFPHSNSVIAIAISSDGKRIATAQEDKTALIWDAATGQPVNKPFITREQIEQIEFSPDGSKLAVSGSADSGEGRVELWDIASGQLVGHPLVHRDSVNFFEFSPDGRQLATACEDHTARVWDAATGDAVTPWLPLDFEALQVSFSPDGARLATLARRGAIRVWNARTGEPITLPILYERLSGNGHVTFSPDGKKLLLSRGGNEAWLRDLQPETASLEELRLLAEVQSCTRFDAVSGFVPLDESALDKAWTQLHGARSR